MAHVGKGQLVEVNSLFHHVGSGIKLRSADLATSAFTN